MANHKVYTCEFAGYWPVGAVAVVVATNANHALALMAAKLEDMGLSRNNTSLTTENLQELDTVTQGVNVLLDGEY